MRIVVHHGYRAQAVPTGCDDRRRFVELKAQVAGHQGERCYARIGSRLRHDIGLVLKVDRRTYAEIARDLLGPVQDVARFKSRPRLP